MLMEERDEVALYLEAKRIVIETGVASTSLLQRRLRIGYAHAHVFMVSMELAGIVSAPNDLGQRKVLITET
jgi:DNA segregation ATPase FtsK/SpoIIIE, S-DNA-T family